MLPPQIARYYQPQAKEIPTEIIEIIIQWLISLSDAPHPQFGLVSVKEPIVLENNILDLSTQK